MYVHKSVYTAPNGSHIQVRQTKQKDGDYKIEWTPTIPGRYQIDVVQNGRAIMGSPFYSEVYDPSRVVIDDVSNAVVGLEAGFRGMNKYQFYFCSTLNKLLHQKFCLFSPL